MRHCPDEDALVGWYEGGEAPTAGVGHHVRACAACQTDLAMLGGGDERDPTGLDRYRLHGVISQGGFGVVCDAWDVVLQREVAVKLSRAEPAESLLIVEAIDQARVAHPNVLSVLDAGTDGDTSYVVMERVRGCDAETAALAADFTPSQARRWVREAARGLAALHEQGLVHGDISPRNLLVGADGRARLIDFGSCRTDGPARGVTEGFVPPEGAAAPSISGDVFALGRTLELLLDRAGAKRRDPGRSVVRRACQRSPSRRYGSAAGFASALRERPPRMGRLRLAFGVALLVVLGNDVVPAVESERTRHAFERANTLIGDGDFDAARPFLDLLRAEGEQPGRDEVRVQSLLLDAAVADAQGRDADAMAMRREAAQRSQGNVDPEIRLEGLAARILDLPVESADSLLDLAQGAASGPKQHSFVAAVRAVAEAGDLSRPLPEPQGPYALVLELAHVLRSFDVAASEPPEVECGSISGAYARGLCWSVSAASALQHGDLRKAKAQASEAIVLIDTGVLDDPCDGQLAYFVRGAAQVEDKPASAERDLRRASALCPEDLAEDKALMDVVRARALLRLGRDDEARTLEEGARLFAETRSDIAEGLEVLADDRRTLRDG